MADRRLVRRLLTRPKPLTLWHASTPKKVRRYELSRAILPPVRGFDTREACERWAAEHGPRTVILELDVDWPVYPLPDHHRQDGCAWWTPADVKVWTDVSEERDD